MKFEAILFDVTGTTVREKNPNTMLSCFANAFRDHGFELDVDFIRKNRGNDNKKMIGIILNEFGEPAELVDPIYQSFKRHLLSNIGNFEPNEGTTELFAYLKSVNTKIGLGSGMERELLNALLEKLNWNVNTFDYIACGDDFDFQRPMPDMILGMMKKFEITKGEEFLKVGDTVMDIREGKNAFVKTCAVLSGTQSEDVLLNEEPDILVESLADLLTFLKKEHVIIRSQS